MVKCRECKARISRSAKACPQCGAKNPAKGTVQHGLAETGNAFMGCGCLLIILGLIALVFLGAPG